MPSLILVVLLASLSLLPHLLALPAHTARTAAAAWHDVSFQHLLTPALSPSSAPTLLPHPLSPPLATSPTGSSDLQPSSEWATIAPLVPSFQDGRLYVLSLIGGVEVVLCLDPSTLSILRTYALPSSLVIEDLHTSHTSLFLLAIDPDTREYSILQLSIESGKPVQPPLIMPYPLLFLGVDQAGQSLLTAVALGSDVVLFNASSGDVIGSYDGGVTSLIVMGGGLHPSNGNVLVVDHNNKSVLVVSPSNALLGVLPLPVDVTDYYSLSLSHDGLYAFVLLRVVDFFVIQQWDLSKGREVNSTSISHFASRVAAITAGEGLGEVWATDVERLTVSRVQTGQTDIPRVVLGPYPIMWFPSGLAISSHPSAVYVSTNSPPLVHQLNSTGQIVHTFPLIDVQECGSSYPASSVSVDKKGNVFIPQCNSTLLIYDPATHNLLRSLNTGKGTRPRSCAPTSRSTVYLTDDNHPSLITELDVSSGKHLSSLEGDVGAAFFDVAVDAKSGDVWASDAADVLLYRWAANGTLISKFDVSSSGVYSQALYGLAVDAVHARVIVAKSVTESPRSLPVSTVLWLDAVTGQVVDTYTLVRAGLAVAVAVSLDGGIVYVTDHNSLAVLLFDQKQKQQQTMVAVQME